MSFFQRCLKGLNPTGGLIVIKDNITSEDFFDSQDSSVIRSLSSILALIERAGLTVIKEEEQEDFPSSMYTVKM